MMEIYEDTRIVAEITTTVGIYNDLYAVTRFYEDGSFGNSEYTIPAGSVLEYFFTNHTTGYHYLYDNVSELGFWVTPDVVKLHKKEDVQ